MTRRGLEKARRALALWCMVWLGWTSDALVSEGAIYPSSTARAVRSIQYPYTRAVSAVTAQQPFEIMIFGDSVMGGDELSDELVELYAQQYGFCGGMGGIGATEFDGARFSRRFGSDVFSGATAVHDLNFSFVDFALLPAGGFTQFGAAAGIIGMTGTVFEVWYMVSNTFGGFDIRTNDYNLGGAMNVATTIVAHDPTLGVGVTTNKVFRLTNSAQFCSVLRCTGLSNSCVIKSMGIFDYTHPGVIWNVQSRGGETLANWATVPTNQYGLMWQQWNPEIVLLKTVNGGAVSISNNLAALSGVFDYYIPGSSVSTHGMHPSSVNDPDVVAENVALKKWSLAHVPPYDYFDTHALFWDNYTYAYMMDMLYPNPNVHLNQRGANYVAWAYYLWANLLGDRGIYRGAGLLRVPQPVSTFGGFNFWGGLPNASSNAFTTWLNGTPTSWIDPNGMAWLVPTNGTPLPANYTVVVQLGAGTAATNNVQTTNSLFGTIGTGSTTLTPSYFQNTNRVSVLDLSGDYYTGATPIPWRFFGGIDGAAVNAVEGLVTPPANVVQGTWTAHLEWTTLTNSASVGAYTIGGWVQFYGGAGATATLTNKTIVSDNFSTNHTIGLWSTNGPVGATAAAGLVSRRASVVLR